MPSLFARITQGLPHGRRFSSMRRSDVIFVLLALLGALFAALLVIDAYALYLLRAGGAAPAPAAGAGVTLKEQDIDAAVEILNEREEKLRILLGGNAPEATAATSTPQ